MAGRGLLYEAERVPERMNLHQETQMLKRVRRNDVGLSQRGFSVLQLVITIAIISIVSTFAVMGISRARASRR